MKKALLFSALALAAFTPMMAQEEQTPETKRVYRVPVERPTPWTIITTSETISPSETIPLVGGLTGAIYDAIDDNPFTYWKTDPNKCDGTQDDHSHWFMIDRGENAPAFNYVSFQQRVIDVMEGNEETAAWNGAIDKADIYLTNEDLGLWGGSANADYDNSIISGYTSLYDPTLKVDVDIYNQNRQVFDFGAEHSERYILVVITHAINPHGTEAEDKFACLAEFNLYGNETIEDFVSFETPYNNPWGTGNEEFSKGHHNARGTYCLTLSGGYINASTPYLQKASYKLFEHDDTAYNLTNIFTYKAKKGATVTVTPTASGAWMHNYLYVDWDGDGFTASDESLNENGSPKDGSDIVAYNYYNGKSSAGTTSVQKHNNNEPLTFTIPSNIQTGTYRVRYKLDWDYIQPNFSYNELHKEDATYGGQVIVDFLLEVIDPLPEYNVIIKFPHPVNEGEYFTQTFENVPESFDITDWFNAQDTPIESSYNFLGVEGSNIVSEDNTEFTAFGSYKVEFDKTYRVRVKPQNSANKFMIYSHTDNKAFVNTSKDKSNENILSPDRLWYFKYKDLTETGLLKVTLHSLSLDDNLGATTNGANGNQVTFTEEPTTFVIQQINNGNAKSTDFALRVDGTNYGCLNDFANAGILAVYNAGNANSINDNGAIIRLSMLNPDMIDGIDQFQVNGVTFPINEEKKEAAKNCTIAEMRELFTYDEDAYIIGSAKALYKATAGTEYTEGEINVPGYIPANEEHVAALRAALLSEDLEQIKTAYEAFNAATISNPSTYTITPGAIYTIKSTENVRGYLCNTDGRMTSTAGKTSRTFDSSSDDFKFTFITIGDNTYMYNLGAGKFLNAFGEKTDGNDNMKKRTDYTWCFSEVPTHIRSFITFRSAEPHSFCILGGVTSGSAEGFTGGTHEGGITLVNNIERNILVTMGVTNRTDGNGLYAECVGKLTDEQLKAIVDAATATLASIPVIETEFDNINGIVNHFNEATHSQLYNVTNGGGYDHIAHLVANGERQGFDADKVYNFFVNETEALRVDPETKTLVVDEFDAANTSFNLHVVEAPVAADVYMDAPEAKTYNFVHTILDETGAGNPENMSYNETTDHLLDMSELGKVKLNGQALVAKVGTGTATTGIRELTAGQGAMKVYDLQGRKLAAPAKGINIINGQKVIVK